MCQYEGVIKKRKEGAGRKEEGREERKDGEREEGRTEGEGGRKREKGRKQEGKFYIIISTIKIYKETHQMLTTISDQQDRRRSRSCPYS